MTIATSPPALLAQGLSKSFGTHVALHPLDLRLEAGVFHALLGPNGAGKSTLIQLLTGLFNPDQGEVSLAGIRMGQHPAQALRHLGVVFQQPALDVQLSVRANCLFHTDLHGMARANAHTRIDALAHAMGLSEVLSKPVAQLSGGTRRKVELVRALLHSPRVLLMDEATVGLDPASRSQLLATVRQLCAQQGTAVLWATHLMEEAEQADALTVLVRGHAVFQGRMSDFMAQAPDGFATRAMALLHQGLP